MELGHFLTRSGLTYPEVSSKVCHEVKRFVGNCPQFHKKFDIYCFISSPMKHESGKITKMVKELILDTTSTERREVQR